MSTTSSTSRKRKEDGDVKRRSSRACDRCRKAKNKCDRVSDGGPCESCIVQGLVCIFSPPSTKRGPAKGYLHALESRCHAVEAVLGIFMSLPDQRAIDLLTEIAEDPFARDVLDQVNNSAFGPRGRAAPEVSQATGSESTPSENVADPFRNGPTNHWQDTIIAKFKGGTSEQAQAPQPYGLLPVSGGSGPSSSITQTTTDSTPNETDYDTFDEEDGLGLGQLTITDNQIRFRGKSSGLHLLDQSSHSNRGVIWRLNDSSGETRINVADFDIQLPSIEIQEYLLRIFQDFIYAAFPIIDQGLLWNYFYAINRGENIKDINMFKILLLSTFAIAGHQSAQSSEGHQEPGTSLGRMFFDQAKQLLDYAQHISHVFICQSFLLLALREFGMGSLTHAWQLAGSAIRMAQDLGLHRSADNWVRGGKNIFDEQERMLRKRIWYGCLQLDKYMSMFMGRPVTIHPSTFDTLLPDEIEVSELQLWPFTPHPGLASFPRVPARIMSSWNANSTLSVITCEILERMYAVKGKIMDPASYWSEAKALENKLCTWAEKLPPWLQINTQEGMDQSTPHNLTLHMQWECAMIVLYLPCICLQKISNSVQSTQASQALDVALMAASRIHAIASVYNTNFGLANAVPFFGYDLFSAGTIWVAALSLYPQNLEYQLHLDQCLAWLNELKPIWPSAIQHCALLQLQGNRVRTPQQVLPMQANFPQQQTGPINFPIHQQDIFEHLSSMPDENFLITDFQRSTSSPFNWLLNVGNIPSGSTDPINEGNPPL